MSDEWKQVGRRVRERREELGMTQEALAAAASVGTATVRKLEGAKQDRYQSAVLAAISRALGWGRDGIDRLLRGEEPERHGLGPLRPSDSTDYNSRIARMPDRVRDIIDRIITTEEEREQR